jgi:hypothetical protein
MPFRFLLILAIAWQPLALWGAAGHAAPAEVCTATSCCTTVERVSCCGERIVEQICGKSGGACHCASAPTDTPDPRPEAPQPRTERETLVAVPSPPVHSVVYTDADGNLRPPFAAGESRLAGKTHNEIQALLGIWRT